ncbi:MAG: hypothetical protein ACFFAN_01980 [Promethearchaeota archaeon]
MKAKYFLLIFLLLIFGAFCATTNTKAVDTSLGVSEGEEYIWEVKIVDLEGLEDLFTSVDVDEGGIDWRENVGDFSKSLGDLDGNSDEVGAKWKIKIDWINESDDKVIYDNKKEKFVEIDVWQVFIDGWSTIDPDNDFNPNADDDEFRLTIYQDPDDLNAKYYNDILDSSNIQSHHHIYPICPILVADYLDDLDFIEDKDWIPLIVLYDDLFDDAPSEDEKPDEDDITYEYDVEGNKLILDNTFVYDSDDDDASTADNDWEYEEFTEEWTWDENSGVCSLYQLINDDDEILYEYALSNAIPSYELPILLGVTAGFAIGLIYIIRKRK